MAAEVLKRGIAMIVAFLFIGILGCSSSSTPSATEDSSASGSAAASVGGAISSSSSGGTLSMYKSISPSLRPLQWLFDSVVEKAFASVACPTVLTANGSGCTNSSGKARMTYSACSFGTSTATWTGTLQASLGTGSISCGSFPSPVSTTLDRQFVDGSGNPSSGIRVSASGVTIYVDHSTADLGNYEGDTIATNIASGYGDQVTFNGSGARTGVTIRQRVYSTGFFDHSVTGALTISESGTTRSVSGTVSTYHNIVRVKGTTTFSAVVYNNTCCLPVSGTISTSFAKTTASPTNLLTAAIDGKTESLSITGCGTGTLTAYNGAISSVILNNCY